MINNQLTADMKEAMKNKDKATLSTIRMIQAAIQRKEQDVKDDAIKNGIEYVPLTEEAKVAVVQTFKKQTDEEIAGYVKAGKTERVAELTDSLNVIKKYLPVQINKEAVVAAVQQIIKNMGEGAGKGVIIKAAMQELKGKAENRMISDAVNTLLN